MIHDSAFWKVTPFVVQQVAQALTKGKALPADLFKRGKASKSKAVLWVKFDGFRLQQDGKLFLLNGDREVMELDISRQKAMMNPGDTLTISAPENTRGMCKFTVSA